jgi:5-methylthioadenosine/S-adenosylhomocysteine deaminase
MSAMKKVDHIIHADYILPMDKNLSVIERGAIAIKGNKILDIGTHDAISKNYTSKHVIPGDGKLLLPGLINTHTHAPMVFFRGMADDLPLNEWLHEHIWPAENRWFSPAFISDATELACLEMVKGGVTVYHDMYFYEDAAAAATKKIGMRGVLGTGILDFQTAFAKNADEYLKKAEHFAHDWKKDELITPCIAPHAIYTCGTETLKKSKALAEKLQVPLHIHLSETQGEVHDVITRFQKKPVAYLDSLGFLDETVLAAHCVWIEDDEIELLAKRKVGVSHCIESNLKLASGLAPIVTMLDRGVKVTFGTDGAASNNDLNIISEMSTTAKVHKALSKNPTVLNAKTVLLMATRWGTDVLGLGKKIGSLQKGKCADMITINLRKPHLTPLYNVYSHIVYAAMASDIETVMINGKTVVNEGKLCTADEEEILSKAKEWQEKIIRYK